MRRLTIRKIPAKLALLDDVGALCRHTFVIVGKATKSRPVLESRIGHDVDDVRAVPQFVQLIECEKTRAGEIRFLAKHAIKLNRMPDRLMNLQTKLAATKNQGACCLRRVRRRMERTSFLSDARRIFDQ